MDEEVLQLKLSGEGINPASIRAGEIAIILTAIEDIIVSIVKAKNPDLDKDNLTVALIDVDQGSLVLTRRKHVQYSTSRTAVTCRALYDRNNRQRRPAFRI